MHPEASKRDRLARVLLDWYAVHGRKLPWRGLTDPYKIWVSEVMLQQTRVETVVPYFRAWMRTFPTLASLAQATEQGVLNLWEGLGYYRRALNLLKAARVIQEVFGGQLPRNAQALRELPGIGRYTAGAIASIAFGMDEPALDANIKRVYARIFDVSIPVNSPSGETLLWDIARENLPAGKAGEFNQALMDLGAAVCTPNNPDCPGCPLRELCLSHLHGLQAQRPVKTPRKTIPHYLQAVAVILREGRVLLARRPTDRLLAGMWEFPGVRVETEESAEFETGLQREYNLVITRTSTLPVVKHAYTHFRVTAQPYLCELASTNGQENLTWVDLNQLDDYPMGKVDRMIATSLGGTRK